MPQEESRLPGIPVTEVKLDGSEKNLSLLKPESLIERSIIQTTPDQRLHAYDRESLWLEQKQKDLNTNEKPVSDKDQLIHDMDQIMVKLVEENTKYGTHCFPMGYGESSAVLLLTPVKALGEKRPDPTGYDIEESQDVTHTYALITRRGFFGIKFIKGADATVNLNDGVGGRQLPDNWIHEDHTQDDTTQYPEYMTSGMTDDERKSWHKANTHAVSTNTFDERYAVSERNLAHAVQESMWNSNSKTRSEIESTAEPAYGETPQEVADRKYLDQRSTDGLTQDSSGRYDFRIGTYSISTGGGWLLQKIDGEYAANLVRDAMIASRANGEKRIIEPQDETRKQLQVARAILDILD